MTDTYIDQLADVLVNQKGAEPSTSRILAQLVVDGAAGGSIPDAIEAARTGYPNLFRPAQTMATAPTDESVTERVLRQHREAAARVPGADDAWASAPITARVMREAGRL